MERDYQFCAIYVFGHCLADLGALGDRYGRKLMVVRAIIGLAVSMTLMGFATNIWQLLFLRLLQGAISGFIAASLSFVAATTPPGRSGYAIGILQSTISAGSIVGAMLGGVLSDVIGIRNVLFTVGAMCAISSVIVILYVKEPVVAGASAPNSVFSNLRLPSARNISALYCCLFSQHRRQSSLQPIMPFYLEHLGALARIYPQ